MSAPGHTPPAGFAWIRPEALHPAMGPFVVAWETSPAAVVVVVGDQHVLVYQNAASRSSFGRRPLGVPLLDAFPEVTAAALAPYDEVLATGRPRTLQGPPVGLRDVSGSVVHLRRVLAPLVDADGRPLGIVVTAIDRTAEVSATLASNRARLLAEVSVRVSEAADADAALTALTDTLVPEVADVAAVYVFPETSGTASTGSWSRSSGAPRDRAPAAVSWSPALQVLGLPPNPTAPDEPAPWDATLAAGRSVILPLDAGSPAGAGHDPVARAWLDDAQAHNLAVVPLVVAGEPTGALALLAAGERSPFTTADLPFLEDVAARAGAAIAQARAHRRTAHVSHLLQQALLPTSPPALPGLEVAARYLPGAKGVEVGGDWWDVARIDDQRIAIGVGDVSGHGVDAAVVMGHARAAMRAGALAGLEPRHVLHLLDEQLRQLIAERHEIADDGPEFATAVHGVLDLEGGTLRMANAGHLPVLLHVPGHEVQVVSAPPGAPLGTGLAGYTDIDVHVPDGASLLFFTDGLVEDRRRDLDQGLHSLARALTDVAHLPVQAALDQLLRDRPAGGLEGTN